jgi:hypothetical protein
MQVMNRFLNRLPTVTIREGHRVKVYLTSDLELPAYQRRPWPAVLTEVFMSRVFVVAFAPSRVSATPAHAQIPVIDVAHLTQAVLIAQRAQRHLDELRRSTDDHADVPGAGAMEHYRMPPIAVTRHDAGRWRTGGAWLRRSTAAIRRAPPTGRRRCRWSARACRLTWPAAGARQMFERQYATIEISDSVAMMGGHQVGALRGYHGQLQDASRTSKRRAQRPAALPRDDGHPRQDRRRRAARAPAGHGDRTSCCRTPWSSCSRAASASATPRPPP